MAGLLATLIKPDREDDPDRGVVVAAANILQVGEFQFLQLAYREWFGQDMPEQEFNHYFRSFIVQGRTPGWGIQHARRIIDWDARGLLNLRHPDFHRFDNVHYTNIPLGTKRFAVAVACLAIALGGSLLLSHMATDNTGNSVLPPYFDEDELERPPPSTNLRGS